MLFWKKVWRVEYRDCGVGVVDMALWELYSRDSGM